MATSKEIFAQAQLHVHYKFPPTVKLRQRLDIKLLKNENVFITDCMKIGNKLVFTNKEKKQLIIYNLDVNMDYNIILYYQPWFLTKDRQ